MKIVLILVMVVLICFTATACYQLSKYKNNKNPISSLIVPTKTVNYGVLPQIADTISYNDDAVVSEVKACVEDYMKYYTRHKERYSNRGIDDEHLVKKDEMCLLGMIDELIDKDYVVSIDWRSSKEDILYNLNLIKDKLQLPINLEEIKVGEDEETYEALIKISKGLKLQGYALGCIGTGNDSYDLLIAKESEVTKLEELSNQYSYYITFDWQES